ncbi:LON peptidase substrate-binding domain-containing protein [Litorilituus lipolyticus]|uniref:Lon N-terminal domain-containing protein n=1 Tax=Litorilituus lipolyticus TaxID=2491017 RepID=A0A502KKI8_9GAMM|nr:LON peptidase substrate-binding domain-containing protein [Litorilituus lipolyticus]TPH12090.1 hypothetical protein EPA86_17185 [Litorilituus lipolyticus]
MIEQEISHLFLPIFPLSAFILPEGKLRLRIFEAKYAKMLSLISAHQMFVIQLTSKTEGIKHNDWGSLVKIQDFNQGDDGLLEIDVHCCALVELSNVKVDDNNLAFAKVNPLYHWSQNTVDDTMVSSELEVALNEVIYSNSLLSHLYQHRLLNNSHWVVARWLEILPISLTVKSQFIRENNFSQAKDFVNTVII